MTGHIRQRSPGSFELRYTLGTDAATGRRKVVTTTLRGTRKDAEKELRRLLRTVDTGEHVDPTRMTVGEWLNTWLAAITGEVAPRTHETYTELTTGFLRPAFGNLLIAHLTPTHIQRAYAEWAVGGRRDGKPGGLSAQTRRHLHNILRSALTRAVEQQVIGRNPCDAFRKRLPKIERKELAALSVDQCGRLLEAIRHQRVYWPVLLALATGMRRGEILALRWRHVDLDRCSIRVTESLEATKAGLRFKPPKSGRTRAVALPAFAVEELRRLRREQAEGLLKLGVRQGGDTLLCGRTDGEPMLPTSLTHEFAKIAGCAEGVPRVRFHDLRHSHATQLLIAGVHPKIVQERLGHSTITLTLDLYSHVTETMQEDAAARLDSAFRSGKTTSA